MAKTIAKGVGQVGQGLSTFGELIPPVEFDGSPLKLLPGRKIKRAYISYIQYLEINVYMFPSSLKSKSEYFTTYKSIFIPFSGTGRHFETHNRSIPRAGCNNP